MINKRNCCIIVGILDWTVNKEDNDLPLLHTDQVNSKSEVTSQRMQ